MITKLIEYGYRMVFEASQPTRTKEGEALNERFLFFVHRK